jgi:hypothetical protein
MLKETHEMNIPKACNQPCFFFIDATFIIAQKSFASNSTLYLTKLLPMKHAYIKSK